MTWRELETLRARIVYAERTADKARSEGDLAKEARYRKKAAERRLREQAETLCRFPKGGGQS